MAFFLELFGIASVLVQSVKVADDACKFLDGELWAGMSDLRCLAIQG